MKTSVAFALTAVLATAFASSVLANEAAAQPKADVAKGQELSTNVCAACHTNDGSRGAPANPILQGQHPEYIFKQLSDFKSGKRDNPIMKGMVAALTEADMKNVAAFYAGKQAKPGFAKHKDTIALGEKIYRGGIADKQVPACAGCHSPTGAGIPAQYPRVGGQHADYVEAQLKAFRDHKRLNNIPMQQIAAHMSDDEMAAVADYIAGLH